MTSMSITQVAKQIDASVIGDAVFSSVSTDTRNISRGDLFIALQGPSFDGHDYIDQATDKGAVAVMVNHEVQQNVPQIVVNDTRIGLGRLASVWRDFVNPKVVALTGSNGKTTLKEMLSSVLSIHNDVLATKGNFNNDIGVPLTLLRLQNESVAIVEMGANHIGEIEYLTQMVRPDIAILNNAGTAHIGEFGSEENIARAKAEILKGLDDQGIFIYNHDSKWNVLWQELAQSVTSVSFGLSEEADYQIHFDQYQMIWDESGFNAEFSVTENKTSESYNVKLALAGMHNAMNALAAISASRELGVDIDAVKKGLLNLKPVTGRLNPIQDSKGRIIIDDSYNANPDSVAAAIDVLVTAPGRKILVLGDLAELGELAKQAHQEIGELAKNKGVDVLYTCGLLSEAASLAFSNDQLISKHFTSQQALINALEIETDLNDVILIKGSRSAKMDQVVVSLSSAKGAQSC